MVGSAVYTSAPFIPTAPGRYRWVVSYSGDLVNAPVASTCGQPGSITVVPQVPGDYDGDGDTDVAIYRPGEGRWYIAATDPVTWGGAPGDVPVPGDYDGTVIPTWPSIAPGRAGGT